MKISNRIIGIGMALVLMIPGVVRAAENTKFDFDKEQVTTKVDGEFTLTLEGLNVSDLYGFEVALAYDEEQLSIAGKPSVTAIQGFSVGPKRAGDNKVYFGCTQMGSKSGLNGDLELGKITFKAKAEGNYKIVLDSVTVVDSKMKAVNYKVGETVTIKAGTVGVEVSGSLKDIKGHWAEESIKKIVDAGYMVGKTETQFMPKDNLTRAEMATILDRIVNSKEIATNVFKDIKGTEWYADSILRMSSKGLIKGYEDNSFRPKNNITRAETVVLLARKAKEDNTYQSPDSVEALLGEYKDMNHIPSWAKNEIAWAVSESLIKGDNSNNLNMQSNVTRAEFAAILCRWLGL